MDISNIQLIITRHKVCYFKDFSLSNISKIGLHLEDVLLQHTFQEAFSSNYNNTSIMFTLVTIILYRSPYHSLLIFQFNNMVI